MCTENQITIKASPIKKEIFEIFSNCQRTNATHQRNALILKELYESSSHEEFWCGLKNILKILLTADNGPIIERLLKFFGTFCSVLATNVQNGERNDSINYEGHPLLSETLSFMLKTSPLIEDIIRIRSCQIINIILDNLIGAEISVELCEELENNLLERLQDPKNIVRQQAIIAIHRLQDPFSPGDVIINKFIDMMNLDAFPKVRQLCIEKIALRKDVISNILVRTRDQDPNVRLAAYKRLSGFAKCLKIHEKQLVLHSGFLDQSDKVKDYISSTLIKTWLEFYGNDILKLMNSLRLDACEKDIKNSTEIYELVLKVIFKTTPVNSLTEILSLNENRLVPTEKLNWELVSYWRIYVEYLSNENHLDEELEKVVPELIYFCDYIKQFYLKMPKQVTCEEFLEQQFILKQLFLITKTFDFGDVTNRKCLNVLVKNVLENVVLISDVIKVIISNLEHSIPNVVQQTQYVSEIISEILYPMNTEEAEQIQNEKQFKICQLTVKLNELRNEQENAINQENFVEAERLKNELSALSITLANLKNEQPEQYQEVEKKTDILTTIKCLDIATAILLSPKVTKLTASLKTLLADFIQELLIDENDNVRVKAFECYGLCCIIDKEIAITGIHIFSTPIFAYQNGEECDTQTLLVCIAAVVDMLRIYGPQLMAAPKSDPLSESMDENQEAVFVGGTSLTNILQGLVDLMDDDQYEIQEQAGRAICQLVLSNRIVSPSLISRLVLKWCNPATDNECNTLKQIIGFTLQNIPLIPDCTEQLMEAVFITLKALYSAPRISPLADVNVENIAKFLLALCNVSPNSDYVNNTMASTIFEELTKKPTDRINGLFAKMLLLLDIPNNQTSIEELLNHCDSVLDVISEKAVVKNIKKLTTKLNAKAVDAEQTTTIQENEANATKLAELQIFENEEDD